MEVESSISSINNRDIDPKECRQCFPHGPEKGEKWDEPLEVFLNGSININFTNNIIGYTNSELISGTVDVVLKEKMKFKNLVLKFAGQERCFLNHEPNLPL
jgi:hypothetical protein